MDYIRFEKIVKECKDKHPIWFSLDSNELATEKDIEKIQKYFNVKLPFDFIYYLKKYGGGNFAFSYVYSAISGSEWYIIDKNKHEIDNFIVFSDNGAGDYYGFRVENGKCESRVSVYNHDDSNIVQTQFINVYDFLVKIALRFDEHN